MTLDTIEEVISVNHNELRTILKSSKDVNLPLMIHGTIGIGKSEEVRRFAEDTAESENDREFVAWNEVSKEKKEEIVENPEEHHVFLDIRLSEYEPSDLKGLPDMNGEEEGVEWKPPMWAVALSQKEASGTIFLDEANLAPPSVQKAFYKLILDRQVGEYTLSDDVFIVGAGNIAGQDRADIQEFPAPLRNRFTHVHLRVPDGGKDGNWTSHAIDNDFHEYVTSYIGSPAGAEDLFKFKDGNKDAKAYATPRTWEYVSKMIKKAEERNGGSVDLDTVFQLTATAIGQGVAQSFRAFLELREEVDWENYLDEPEKAKELKTDYGNRVDIQRSVVTGLAAEYKAETDHLEPILKISQHVPPEIGTLMLRLCKEYHPQHFQNEIYNSEVADQVADKYAKLLSD